MKHVYHYVYRPTNAATIICRVLRHVIYEAVH